MILSRGLVLGLLILLNTVRVHSALTGPRGLFWLVSSGPIRANGGRGMDGRFLS